ncbi:MAG: phage tail family protein [Chloroflexi bacterium]|nr:phage tail family protein [Chloroflexota bacterium]
MPIVLPPLATAGPIVFEWIDPGNVTRNLSGASGVKVRLGTRGMGLPRVSLVEDKLPHDPGSFLRYAGITPRVIELPLLIRAESATALESLMDSVFAWFATADEQTQTPGYLRVTLTGGTQRQIACYYAGGLEGASAQAQAGNYWLTATVELRAVDPWPTDITDTSQTWTTASLPSVTIINPGQLDAFPVWTITGPVASGQIVANSTTGKSWTLNVAIAEPGLASIIDTRPSNQRPGLVARRADGLTLFPFVAADSEFWHLQPGANNLTITLTGTGSNTRVAVSYRARYRSLLAVG